MKLSRLFCVCLMAALACVSVAQAANDVWDNNPGGNWETGANWADNSTPGNSDTATFSLAQSYTATFGVAPANIQNLTVSAGTVTFQNSGGVKTLNVTSGGALDAVIGSAALNLGTAANTLPMNLTVGDDLILNSGGILNINAGSVVTVPDTGDVTINSSGQINVGSASTSGVLTANGNVTVDGGVIQRGSDSTFVLGTGKTMTITGGGRATFTGNYFTDLNAVYNVSAVGSKLEVLGGIFPTLGVHNGAQVNVSLGGLVSSTNFMDIGIAGNGTLSVDGSGSSALANPVGMNFWGGNGSTATVTFSNNAVGTFNGGIDMASTSTAGTTAMVNVESGADLNVGDLSLAAAGGATTSGVLNVQGRGSTVTQSGFSAIVIGHSATGTAAINIGTTSSGGTLTTSTGIFRINPTGTVTVGSGANTGGLNANGNVTIDGGALTVNTGSTFSWAVSKTMTILNGGVASLPAGSLPESATYNVSGAGSQLLLDGSVGFTDIIGKQINVAGGAQLATDGEFGSIFSGWGGALNVSGTGSIATFAADAHFGDHDGPAVFSNGAIGEFAGQLTVFGPAFDVLSGAQLQAASTNLRYGVFTVDGSGSGVTHPGEAFLSNGATLRVLNNATYDAGGGINANNSGVVEVSSGGHVTVGGAVFIAANAGSTNTFLVDGPGSSVTQNDDTFLRIGGGTADRHASRGQRGRLYDRYQFRSHF